MVNLYNSYWKIHQTNKLSDFNYKWPVVSAYLPKNETIKILDHGCGNGVIFKKLSELNPNSNFTGVDVSDFAIKKDFQTVSQIEIFCCKRRRKNTFKIQKHRLHRFSRCHRTYLQYTKYFFGI